MGFFDGVHRGHGALMERAKERARELDAEPAVLTFDRHPDLFVKGWPVELICSAADRAYILNRWFGLRNIYYIHFNAETMRMDWRDFLRHVRESYGAVHFVVGFDFRFGDGGRGDPEKLTAYCRENGLGCDVIPPVMLGDAPISSTRIREKLREGDMAAAAELLGHPHLLTDVVRTGFRLGRTMDFPTVNMRFEEGVLIPRRGVYAARVQLPDGPRNGVTNIGVRPTFHGDRVTVETNIFGCDADLYGQRLCVELHAFLRPERRFDSQAELQAQIARDAAAARELLGERPSESAPGAL